MPIRTPLNAVTGLIDMVMQQGLSVQQVQHANQAKDAAQNLLVMLNRMLDFARVESNQAQLIVKLVLNSPVVTNQRIYNFQLQ